MHYILVLVGCTCKAQSLRDIERGGGMYGGESVGRESVWLGAVGVMSEPTTQPFSLCFMLTFCCFPTLSACVPL